MKWLKIKKCLKIFSVIICSIFIFSNKASALEFEFQGKKYDTDVIFGKDMENANPSLNLDNYKYRMCFYESINKDSVRCIALKGASFINLTDYSNIMNPDFDVIKNPNYVLTVNGAGADGYDMTGNNKIPRFYIRNDNTSVYSYNTYRFPFPPDNYTMQEYLEEIMIYSNVNFNPKSSDIKNYYFKYTEEKKENPLKYRMQFNNDVSPDLKQITFDFSSYEFTEGSNPVKTKIEIGSNSLLAEEIPNYLNSYIYGYGTDGVKYDMSEYIDFTIDTTNYLTTKELTFTYTLKKELPKDILRIFIYYDFETINNNYFFNVFDNATWGSVFWEYIENFLVGYKKYTFPEGYDLAIIRSKSFKDLESFYISDKVYFTNSDYDFNLKLYDFKNKIEKYNFNSLTQYLINNVYLKIPIKIDETNNIFPVLTKPMNNESGVFYLKDDLFVQFVNSENLDSIIDGIPEDNFNDNNDLNIDSDIGNLNPPQQNEQSLTVFFNEFWKMFEKFSDILSYITSCFTQFFISLPTTIQFFLCVSFAFVIYKMIVFFIL